jgi:hypothetical protein
MDAGAIAETRRTGSFYLGFSSCPSCLRGELNNLLKLMLIGKSTYHANQKNLVFAALAKVSLYY